MGRTGRKEKDILLRRDEILDAAERLFEKNSIDSVTMDHIASEAEFTKQTLYTYFKGKDEILAALYLRAARLMNDILAARLGIPENNTGYRKLDSMRGTMVEIASTKPFYIKMMAIFQLKDLNDFQAMEIFQGIMEESAKLETMLSGCVLEGIMDGSMSPDIDPLQAMLFLKSCTSGVFNMATHNEQFIRDQLKTDTATFIKNTLEFSMRAFVKKVEGKEKENKNGK